MTTSVRRSGRTEEVDQTEEHDRDAGEMLALLDAEYTQEILKSIRSEPKPARALAEQCGASRPTVYRRLNSLQDVGLVKSEMAYDADGHHRTVFEATVETLSVAVTDDGLFVTAVTDDPDRDSTSVPERGARTRA